MITKLDIQEKDGFLIMEDFPTNCIFNKVKTGCGATTIALTNEGVSKCTPSLFYVQSPDFHKLGLCYYLKILYL